MGQRSQIYIKYNVKGEKGLIARYYSWNYGERMISRARGIIEILKEEFVPYNFNWKEDQHIKKLIRVCDTNFDMRDIAFSSNIIKEVKEYFNCKSEEIFRQDNNDGQLFVEVNEEKIKYCFKDYYNISSIMDGEQYMRWNCEDENKTNWHEPDKYLDTQTIKYTEKNIKYIKNNAILMTKKEINEFINTDYSYLFNKNK